MLLDLAARRCAWPLAIVAGVACSTPAPTAPTAPTAAAGEQASPGVRGLSATTITGTLLGHDGRPLKLAHVHIGETTVAVDSAGHFAIAAPNPGLSRLYCTAVDSEDFSVPVFLDGQPVQLDVVLGTYDMQPDATDVSVLLEGMSSFAQALPMTRRADGTFAVTVAQSAEQMGYQLINVVEGRSFNGTMAESYRYDGGGNYYSVLPLGHTEIVYEPARLPPSGVATRVEFRDAGSRATRISAIAMRLAQRLARAGDAGRSDGQKPTDDEASERARMRAEYDRVVGELSGESDPRVQQMLLIELFTLPVPSDGESGSAQADPKRAALAARLMAEVPADSSLWRVHPQAAINAGRARGGTPFAHTEYAQRVAENLPDRNEGASLVLSLLVSAASAGDKAAMKRFYVQLTERFDDTRVARLAGRFNPDKNILPGFALPAFSFPSMDDATQLVASEQLRGTVYLLDFWATWCGPCVREMATLHEMHKEYQQRGFTIVSVAVRDQRDAVRSFRRNRWPMPWPNVFIEDDQGDEIGTRFEIVGLPSAILVGADGRIIAVNEAVRGHGLIEVLGRIFPDAP